MPKTAPGIPAIRPPITTEPSTTIGWMPTEPAISRGWMKYNSLQFRAERRSAGGFYVLGAYTYAKALTNGVSGFGGDLRGGLSRRVHCACVGARFD